MRYKLKRIIAWVGAVGIGVALTGAVIAVWAEPVQVGINIAITGGSIVMAAFLALCFTNYDQ